MTGSIEPAGRRPGAPAALAPGAEERAGRTWWDEHAASYQSEHGGFLGDAGFVWGPEGLDEAEAGLLGATRGLDVLEVGAGAGQCARWLVGQGAHAVALDLSYEQLALGAVLDRRTGLPVPAVQAGALRLPFRGGSFDLACSSYGALPFVGDLAGVHREVARVLRPGGRWVFSVPHPVRWSFPDVPGAAGLTARYSYFDRRPYVETGDDGTMSYVEHHRTVGDHVRALRAAGFAMLDLVEPQWPPGNDQVWGGWSPLRGRLLPGTAVFVAARG